MSKRLYTEEEVAAILRYRHNATTVMDEYQAIREWNRRFGGLDIECAKKHLEDMRENGIRGIDTDPFSTLDDFIPGGDSTGMELLNKYHCLKAIHNPDVINLAN